MISKPTILVYILFILIVGCPDPGRTVSPQPGEVDYIPPDWAEPGLGEYSRDDFLPSRVILSPSPGQYVQNQIYGLVKENQARLLDFPSGRGHVTPDNSSILSLGMAGGRVTFEFDKPLINYDSQESYQGYDFIVFGNASDSLAFYEPGVIEVEAQDQWYLIPGALLDSSCSPYDITYHYDSQANLLSWSAAGGSPYGEITLSGSLESSGMYEPSLWWPEAITAQSLSFSGIFLLPDSLKDSEGVLMDLSRYADCAPTLLRGDFNGDDDLSDPEDYPGVDKVYFYTRPRYSGGTPIDIGWAVDRNSFEPVTLESVTRVRITSASLKVVNNGNGDVSTEIDSLIRVLKGDL